MMNNLSSLILISILYLFSSCQNSQKELAIEEMNNVYQNYIEAINAGKGGIAMEYASQQTIRYHDSLINHILYSEENELKRLPLDQQLWVLNMRHTKAAGYWDTMTVEKWFLQMPQYQDDGFYMSDAMLNPKNCNVQNEYAFCTQKIKDKDRGLPINFIKEDGKWKIQIVTIKPGASDGIKQQIEKTHTTEADYYFYILNTIQKIPLKREDMFTPLKRRPEK